MTKRTMVAVAVLVAGGCYASEPARSSQYGQNVQHGPGLSGPAPLVRTDVARTETEVDGAVIEAFPIGATAWTLRIKNAGDGSMSVLWDESSFIAANGESFGRMIRGTTRRIDKEKAQLPTPVPPRSTATENILIEKLIPYEEYEAFWGPKRWITRAEIEQVEQTRARLRRIVNGGRLHVTISTDAGKKAWSGRVEVVDPPR